MHRKSIIQYTLGFGLIVGWGSQTPTKSEVSITEELSSSIATHMGIINEGDAQSVAVFDFSKSRTSNEPEVVQNQNQSKTSSGTFASEEFQSVQSLSAAANKSEKISELTATASGHGEIRSQSSSSQYNLSALDRSFEQVLI